MNNILEIQGLTKRFESFSLNNISFELPEGFIMGFIGPNGAGKTTTIKSILGMLKPESGKIRIFGRDNTGNHMDMPEHIGVVMDQPFYVDEWKISDVERAVSPFYREWSHEGFVRLTDKFGISMKKSVKELSRGMKMKLMLAVALSHNSRLLILDEPTSGLDPVARDELMDILLEYMSDEHRSILFSTHITKDLEKIADYITFIKDGDIMYTGHKDELIESYSVIKGGLGELNAGQKKHVIGYREYGTGFEGLALNKNLRELPHGILAEPAGLDEIIVYITKEGKSNV